MPLTLLFTGSHSLSSFKYLASKPSLDEIAKKCLVHVKTQIETTLVSSTTISNTSNEAVKVKSHRKNAITDSNRVLDNVKKRPQEQRALVAVYPYTELTLEESNLTVMEKFFGKRFYEWFRNLGGVMDWIAFITLTIAVLGIVFV